MVMVQSLLLEIDAALPQWANVNEQLMALRECNYHLDEAIEFGTRSLPLRPFLVQWGEKPTLCTWSPLCLGHA